MPAVSIIVTTVEIAVVHDENYLYITLYVEFGGIYGRFNVFETFLSFASN